MKIHIGCTWNRYELFIHSLNYESYFNLSVSILNSYTFHIQCPWEENITGIVCLFTTFYRLHCIVVISYIKHTLTFSTHFIAVEVKFQIGCLQDSVYMQKLQLLCKHASAQSILNWRLMVSLYSYTEKCSKLIKQPQ